MCWGGGDWQVGGWVDFCDCSPGKINYVGEQNAEFATRKPLRENPGITLCISVYTPNVH